MPRILAPYSPYDGLIKALSIAAGLNVDLDNANIDRNQGAHVEGRSVPGNELELLATCARHPECTRGLGHSGRCSIKAKIQTKNILPDATGHRQCPYDKNCVNEAGHRGRCKIRPKLAAATETPEQHSPTAGTPNTRRDEEDEEEEEDSDRTVDECNRNPDCTRPAGHAGRCNGIAAAKNPKPPPHRKHQRKKPVAATAAALPPRKRKPDVDIVEYVSSGSEEEEQESEEEEQESESDDEDSEDDEKPEDNENDLEEEKEEEIQIPKWPAKKRARGRLSGVQSDRKQATRPSQVQRPGAGRASGRGGGRGGRPSSPVPAAGTAPRLSNLGVAPISRALAAATPPVLAPTAGSALVQQCRELEAALEVCGVTAYDRLSYSMKFASLPAAVREAQWDALQRHIDGGNVEAVVAAVAAQARY